MKKTYIISFLLFIALVITAYGVGYNFMNGQNGQEEDISSREELSVQKAATDTGKYTSDQTVYILENYYTPGEELTQEKLPMPAEYVGCTREELLKKVQTYAANPSKEDLEKGLTDVSMICFSANKLVLRKTYEIPQTDTAYQIKPNDRRTIVVYYADSDKIYTETDILYDSLPPKIRTEIDNGGRLYGLQEVFDFLENYSS